MKLHLEKTHDKIINEIDLHFKTQKALQNLNGTDFKFWDIFSVDVYDEYKFQCYLKDIEPTREEFLILTCEIENTLINNKYKINWITFEKLYIRK